MLRFGGDYHMYYWGTGEDGFNRICLAVARVEAPHEWRFAGTVLERQAGTAYNALGPSFPFVVPRGDGAWLMYYVAWGVPRDDGKLANTTGLALSDDRGRTWRHAGESPVLALDRPWDHEGTGSVCVLAEGGVFRMYYTALGDYSPRPPGVRTRHGDLLPHIGVGYAESTDGIRWTKPLDGLMVSPPRVRRRAVRVHRFQAVRPAPRRRLDPVGQHLRHGVPRAQPRRRRRPELDLDRLGTRRRHGRRAPPAASTITSAPTRSVVPHEGGLRCWYTGNGFGQTGIGYAHQGL